MTLGRHPQSRLWRQFRITERLDIILTVSCNEPIIRSLMRSNLSPHFKIR